MVNLKEKPFYLKEEDIKWVEETIAGMTTEEKIGQLFVYMVTNRDLAVMKSVIDRFHVGAIRYHNAPKEELYEQNRILQENTKIPLLIASNCEAGGNGGIEGGTAVANGAAVAAADSEELAYEMSCVGASESAAVGCNWNFAPVVDLLFNWRNTIVQTRYHTLCKGFYARRKGKRLRYLLQAFPRRWDGRERSASAYGYQ